MRLTITAVFGFIFIGITTVADGAPNRWLSVTIYNCTARLSQAPVISIADSYTAQYHQPHVSLRQVRLGVYVGEFEVQEPHFWISASIDWCRDVEPVTIVSGHTRHLLLFPGTRIAATDALHWIAGQVPEGIGGVTLRGDGRGSYTGVVDDGCYYFEFVANGNYLLQFQASPALLVNEHANVSGVGESGQFVNMTKKRLLDELIDTSRRNPIYRP